MLRDNIQGLKNPEYLRLAHKAGIKRMNGICYDELRGITQVWLNDLVKDAVTFTENRRAKTVNVNDVIAAIYQNDGVNFAYSSSFKKIKKCTL